MNVTLPNARFDTIIMVDWSGGNQGSVQPQADAIWACIARGREVDAPVYLRHRQIAEDWLIKTLTAERAAGRRVMVGFDFPFGYPVGFGKALVGSDSPFELWDWLAHRIRDTPKDNNRFDVAGQINMQLGGNGPFWGNGLKRDVAGLPRNKSDYFNPFPDKRTAEQLTKGAFTLWQLSGVGSVGGQVLMGLPVLARLRAHFEGDIAVWPFEAPAAPITLVEIWPSLTVSKVPEGWIKDQWQVYELARSLAAIAPALLRDMLDVPASSEGWILGLGFEDVLREAAPPPLGNDCFALPAGVEWTPVDDALADLRRRLGPVVGTETCAVQDALGRILAQPVVAQRAHPPLPNTAVDGYGFSTGRGPGPHELPLMAEQMPAG
ncbi:MAG: molybdopterin molybdenumtransferase MoeA, partial [Pseudomonadota bacterium]